MLTTDERSREQFESSGLVDVGHHVLVQAKEEQKVGEVRDQIKAPNPSASEQELGAVSSGPGVFAFRAPHVAEILAILRKWARRAKGRKKEGTGFGRWKGDHKYESGYEVDARVGITEAKEGSGSNGSVGKGAVSSRHDDACTRQSLDVFLRLGLARAGVGGGRGFRGSRGETWGSMLRWPLAVLA